MIVSSDKIQQRLLNFEFRQLFNELMWNRPSERPFTVTLPKPRGFNEARGFNELNPYRLTPIAEKSGYKVYQCIFPTKQDVPTYTVLKQIEREVAQLAVENIIIYCDAQKELQIWQWVRHERGKPSVQRLSRLHKGQSGEILVQKVSRLLFDLDDGTTITDVAARAKQAFDTAPVTKKFYDRFKMELGKFQAFIDGIKEQGDKEWYASLMLNRLMFIYFIQKKGFLNAAHENSLDGDPDYLRHRLEQVQIAFGQDEFHTFYRYFLLKLFSDLNTLEGKRERTSEMNDLLGRIPYLNGGLFDVHKLEYDNPAISIPDDAFKRVFDFFDEFDWYLDDRPLQNQKEINPDVLGYIFEKYINQKQMGAYYTKEDITEYISKNTIIPFLFNEAEKRDSIAFQADGFVWSLLRDDPDRYIYDAVKHGVDMPLPLVISAGLHDISQRGTWNRLADEEYALPTEIWREVVARRTHYAEVREKIVNGNITSINDLITYNLDITTFARDVLIYCEGPDLLRAFYDSIERVTVLDPTCGSGAFLFSALNILKPLYAACLKRMQEMVNNHDTLTAHLASVHRSAYREHKDPHHIKRFRDILTRMDAHANRDYFILKSIILNNLYGVDIMAEATEICKLRLFLKLVAQVQRFRDIEPLPDIDFNIRSGNTLVGFANYAEARASIERSEQVKGRQKGEVAFQSKMDFSNTADVLKEKAKGVEREFRNFRAAQTDPELEHTDLAQNKRKLRQSQKELEDGLNNYLSIEYGYEKGRDQWRRQYQPFHWFVEFYEIIERNGGFDVIIGNPPYVEYNAQTFSYRITGYETLSCANLYTCVIERSYHLLSPQGYHGMILPLSAFSTRNMTPFIEGFQRWFACNWISFYHFRPSMLFSGGKVASIPTAIYIAKRQGAKQHYSTSVIKWSNEHRDVLFHNLSYCEIVISRDPDNPHYYPKYGYSLENEIMRKIRMNSKVGNYLSSPSSQNSMCYRSAGGLYWKVFINFSWPYQTTSNKQCFFQKRYERDVFVSMFNSSLFWWYYTVTFDTFNLKDYMIFGFRFSYPQEDNVVYELKLLCQKLMDDFNRNAKHLKRGKTDSFTVYAKKSKPIIDEIDRVLAQHYGFTDEELDFIINYDIKYRLRCDSESDEEAE